MDLFTSVESVVTYLPARYRRPGEHYPSALNHVCSCLELDTYAVSTTPDPSTTEDAPTLKAIRRLPIRGGKAVGPEEIMTRDAEICQNTHQPCFSNKIC